MNQFPSAVSRKSRALQQSQLQQVTMQQVINNNNGNHPNSAAAAAAAVAAANSIPQQAHLLLHHPKNPPPLHPPPPLPSSHMSVFDLPDEPLMKEPKYSVFGNNHAAMSSNASLTNFQDPIYMHSSFSSSFQTDGNVDFLPNMYGINEFEFNNVSYESLPAISDNNMQSHSQLDLIDGSDNWYPYTPTFNDNLLSNFSDGSFTSNTDYQDLSASTGSVSTHTPINLNSMTKRSLTMQLQAQAAYQQQHNHHSQPQAQSPLSKNLAIGISGMGNNNSTFSGRTTPNSITNFNESPPSLSHNHRNLSNLGLARCNSNGNGYQPAQPPSIFFQSPIATSPIISNGGNMNLNLNLNLNQTQNPYKSLDINSPILPPQSSFRHNSDSSFNSTTSSLETPRRCPPSVGFTRNSSLHSNNSNIDLSLPLSNSSNSLKSSVINTPLQDIQKPKKHTRKRVLPRSKDGCWICRIKHLKCDEKRPSCLSCQRFGIDCDYSPEKPLYVSDKNVRKEKLASLSLARKSISIKKRKSKVKLLA